MAPGHITGSETLRTTRSGGNRRFTPVSLASDWFVLRTNLDAADNSGNPVLSIEGLTSAEIFVLEAAGLATGLELCVEYVFGETWAALVVNLFGCDSGRRLGNPNPQLFSAAHCVPQALFDADDNHDLAFLPAAASDKKLVGGATLAYTPPVPIDCRASSFVVPVVKVAATGAGAPNLKLLGRLI